MKKYLILFILAFVSICASAQTIQFRTTGYCFRTSDSSWSPWEKSSMLLTIDLDEDLVTIYSPVIQYYKIISEGYNYTSGNAEIIDYRCIDQDGDIGTLRLAYRITGRSEVYIVFNNVAWGYIVVRK